MNWNRLFGIALLTFGVLLLMQGVMRKPTFKAWWQAIIASVKTSIANCVRGVRHRWSALVRWWQVKRTRLWNWKEILLVKLHVRQGRNFRESVHERIGITTNVTDTLTRGAPSPASNRTQIDELVKWREAVENETLRADLRILLGTVMSFAGSLLLAFS